ncbi:MAG: cytochrome C [Anaerolineales bacterium]|nr:MAG: cytochrome C [Anaerolineales bacterium]
MSGLRNLGQAPDGRKGPWERRLLLWIVLGVIAAVLVVVAAYYFDVATESDAFCGLLCHANRPQYVAHEVSAHAEVECGTCHIGPGLAAKVTAKIFGVGELYKQLTNTYERPIAPPVERLRPADVICEQCHWPQKSYEDRIHLISTFAADEENSETRTYLVLRIGGGSAPEGYRGGAHWHIDNAVWYMALDPQRQDIPWVGFMDDGQLVEYQAKDRRLTPEELERLPRREMDCLDCHNRATHVFRKPERSVDEALAADRIDRSLPYIKRQAVQLLSESYATEEEALKTIGQELEGFYRSQYPNLYSTRQQAVEQAVNVIRDIYRQTTFPEMNLTWEAYANNIGHTDFPGCFRCHGSELLNAQEEAISANCNLCHSVPLVAEGDEEPDSTPKELAAPWVSVVPRIVHLVKADMDCLECHGEGGLEPAPARHQGIPAESCVQCHEVAPAVGVPTIPHVLEGLSNCLACHGEDELWPAPSDHKGWINESCLLCHEATSAR